MRSLLTFLFIALLTSTANTATFTLGKVGNGRNIAGILIEGEIVPGDFAKFESEVLRRQNIDPIWLASPGGDMIEAMKIGELIRELKLSVWAPSKNGLLFPAVSNRANAVCASACFYLYAAGVQRRGEVVGIHRPYLPQATLAAMELDAAAQAQSVALGISREFLTRAGVPQSIIEHIASIASNQIVWLTADELSSLNGFIPEFDEWFKAKCAKDPKTHLPLTMVGRFECQSKLLESEQAAAKFRWLLRSAPRSE
ncbi:hypothetical protein [Denitromonas sp.]|uniref:COG3904 family protein n=1 Tax=Denitromonas sp. TaxID=2734609 RepID=UPI002AFF8455|nr:hypothetical protein [Denitromonas sp.]